MLSATSALLVLTLLGSDPVVPSLRYDVEPVLTRLGCNSGTCHGTPTGKNGFRLSLRGFDAPLDLQTLTRETGGRRISRVDPSRSLLLLKGLAEVPHEGGRRLRADSPEYRVLHDWIAAGCPDDAPGHAVITGLEMTPTVAEIAAPQIEQLLAVFATFSDGRRVDVTPLCRFSVGSHSAARVTPAGLVTREQAGEVTVVAEYASRFAQSQILFTEPNPQFESPPLAERNLIDRHVLARLKRLQIEPSPVCTDSEFVRRVYLDVTGRLPRTDEVRQWLASTDPEWRSRLIDQLLDSPEFADWWAMKWTDRLGGNNRFTGKFGALKYHAWIRSAMAENVPEDRFVRELLTASGANYENPPASFWRRLRVGGIGAQGDPLLAAEEISQLFLGIRIQCARCHNHPGEHWTQNDFYGLAAFFGGVRYKDGPYNNHSYDKEDTVYVLADAAVIDPRTGQPAPPRLLGQSAPVENVSADRRQTFANWLTAPDNPWFARNSVNRLWYHLMGRGIIDPVDDLRMSNPPAHPEVLDELTSEFVRAGFDRKVVLRLILNSTVYQLSSTTTATNASDERYFSHSTVRLLQAEQLLDAVSDVTSVPEAFPEMPPGLRAVNLPDGEYKHPFLEAFGRPARALACECERDPATTLAQALQLVGGGIVNQKVRDPNGRAARLAVSDLPPSAIVEELFLAALSRAPSDDESQLLASQIGPAGSNRTAAVEDVLWTLLNHREFLFQH